MLQEIYVIDDKKELEEKLKELFKLETEYRITKVVRNDLEIALKNIPSLIIVNEDNEKNDASEICKKIKNKDRKSVV